MTPAEALAAIRQSGTVEAADGKLKIRVPKDRLARLQPVLEVLRNTKTEVLALLADLRAEELSQASGRLTRTGTRLIDINGVMHAGIWSDLDGPDVRAALRTFGSGGAPVLYLDGPGAPLHYKSRHVAGEPVPSPVREQMEGHPEPWKVREWMLGKVWRFVPWPLKDPSRDPPATDPRTRIWPISQWRAECGRGFVSSERFARPGDKVIKRTNRQATRRWLSLNATRRIA